MPESADSKGAVGTAASAQGAPGAEVFCRDIAVPESAIDKNGHVNNVVYVQWMQEIAISHFESCGGEPCMEAAGCTWVARSHKIEYLRPAYAADKLTMRTWVATAGRVRSLRRYEVSRVSDGQVIARGETDWVCVDTSTGRPRSIPDAVRACFVLRADS